MLIGEVSQRAGISTRMLRYYDKAGIVSPTGRTVGGYREYSTADIRRLFEVESLRTLGLTLAEIRRALDDESFTPNELVGDLIASTEQRIRREQELLGSLQQIAASDVSKWSDVLGLISLMRGLDSDDPSHRVQGALTIARDSAPPARMLAEAVLAESDPNAAGALRWALQRSPGEALSVLEPALGSADADVRRRAVAAIAELELNEANRILVETLNHHDAELRSRAALTLGARGDVRAIATLMQLVISGVRDVEASETLGSLARQHALTEELAGTIAEQLDNPNSSLEVRLRLTQALAELPGEASRATLEALATDTQRPVALTAAFVLRTLDESG